MDDRVRIVLSEKYITFFKIAETQNNKQNNKKNRRRNEN